MAMSNMKSTKDILRSERLIYLRIEDNEQFDQFFDDLTSDPCEVNSNACLPDGYSKSSRRKMRDGSSKYLHHYICLPAEATPPSSAPAADAAAADAATSTSTSAAPAAAPAAAAQPTPIGYVSLSRLGEQTAQHGHGSLSINVAPARQRCGYGAEALRWALAWAFGMARLHKVTIAAFGWNRGALRLYRRLGFVLEGTLRHDIWFMGAWHDSYVLGMLEHEWRDLVRAEARARREKVAAAGAGAGDDGSREEYEDDDGDMDSLKVARIMGCE